MIFRCHLCAEDVEGWVLDHMRVLHPDHADAELWPDGQPVIVDTTLEPDDFGTEN